MTKTEIGMGKVQPFRLSLVGALKALTIWYRGTHWKRRNNQKIQKQ
jgi:hypothetical protein